MEDNFEKIKDMTVEEFFNAFVDLLVSKKDKEEYFSAIKRFDKERFDLDVEVSYTPIPSTNENNIDEYKYSFIWDYSHIGYDIYEEGLAILTLHKIDNNKSFYISKHNLFKFFVIIFATKQ